MNKRIKTLVTKLSDEIAALEAGRSSDWVLVPREMTPAMWKAWEQSHMVSESYQEDYAAMLAAAPQQPTGRSGEASWNNTFRADAKRYAEIMRPEAKATPGTVFASVVDLLDDIAKLPDPFPQQPPPVGVTDATLDAKDDAEYLALLAQKLEAMGLPNTASPLRVIAAAISRQQKERTA